MLGICSHHARGGGAQLSSNMELSVVAAKDNERQKVYCTCVPYQAQGLSKRRPLSCIISQCSGQ